MADPDVYMRPAVKSNGTKYYEYVLIYVDDALVISEKPQLIMDYLSKKYKLKEGSVKEPDIYLGAEIRKFYVKRSNQPDKVRWQISSDLYVKKAIEDLQTELALAGKALATRPKSDTMNLLGDKQASYIIKVSSGFLDGCANLVVLILSLKHH